MKTTAIALAAVLLSGCSGFKLGAFCYLPSGTETSAGQCTIVTIPATPKAADGAKI